MYLQKRDGNMGFDIAPALIIFLVILGAGALVCCGFAVARFMGGEPEDESSRFHRTPEQDSYMREVRERTPARKRKSLVDIMLRIRPSANQSN